MKERVIRLLRWSEKYTKTDMLYLAQGGFWLTLGQVLSSASVFILALGFANLLSKEAYGIYQYILGMASILSVFSLGGMNTAVTRAVAIGYEGILKKSFWVQMKWALLMFFASLAVSIYYFLQHNTALGISFLIVGSFSPLLNSANTYSAYINGKKDFGRLTIYNTISNICVSLLLLLTVILTKNPILLILAYFFYNTAANLYFYLRTIQVYRPNDQQSPENISYGKHLSLMNAFTSIAAYLDTPLVFHFLGPANLAIYSLAIAPPEQLKALLKNISGLALPKFSEKNKSEIKQTIYHKVLLLGLVVAVGVLIYILLAPWFYKTFFPAYLSSLPYSQIFSLSLIAVILYIPFSALQAQMATKELYHYNVWSSAFKIAILVPLVYYFGIWGAVFSTILTRFFTFGLSIWLLKKVR